MSEIWNLLQVGTHDRRLLSSLIKIQWIQFVPVVVLPSHLSRIAAASLFSDFWNGFHLAWLRTSQGVQYETKKNNSNKHYFLWHSNPIIQKHAIILASNTIIKLFKLNQIRNKLCLAHQHNKNSKFIVIINTGSTSLFLELSVGHLIFAATNTS